MEPVLVVTRVSLDGIDEQRDKGYPYQIDYGKVSLLWRDIASISEVNLAISFNGYPEVSGQGSYIHCYNGRVMYVTDEYGPLAKLFLQWQQSTLAAATMTFKTN